MATNTKPTTTAPVGVSFRPSEMVRGGLLNDVDVEIMAAATCIWDYNGGGPDTLAVVLDLQPVDAQGEPDGEVVQQFWSAGNPKDFTPDDAGLTFLPQGTKKQLTTGSNWGMFINSLCERGFPEERIGNTIDFLVGLRAHVTRLPSPKRAGISNQKEDATVLCVQAIIKFPWEKAPAKGAQARGAAPAAKPGPRAVPAPAKAAPTAAAPAPAAQAQDEGADELTITAQSALVELVDANAGSLKVANIRAKAFKALATNPHRNDILALYSDAAWLEANCNGEVTPLMFDGTEIAKA